MGAIMTAIYGGGPFYTNGSTDLGTVIEDLKASGFTTVIEWGLQLSDATDGPHLGDLQLNEVIISQGEYVADPAWPGLLASLKEGATSVNRLLFSLLGYPGFSTFATIQRLIQTQGTGPDSILYKNFAGLKAAIPAIDGIDIDDETLYDQETTVKLSRMLHEIGYEVTFCPYDQQNFWIECLYELNSQTPGLVTGFNLQCYAGGQWNIDQVQNWIDAIAARMGPSFPAATFVNPGLWCRSKESNCVIGSCPPDVTAQFAAWQPTGIQGGFIWLYDDLQYCAQSGACGASAPMGSQAYASAIVQGLSGPTGGTGPTGASQPIGSAGLVHLAQSAGLTGPTGLARD